MPTAEEIGLRIEQVDLPRIARRTAAARRVGELAQQRAAIVAQLEEIERELGDVLTDAEPDITLDELAAFTDVRTSDLTAWLTAGRRPGRGGRRRKAATGPTPDRDTPRARRDSSPAPRTPDTDAAVADLPPRPTAPATTDAHASHAALAI